jgi:hypothetical protein
MKAKELIIYRETLRDPIIKEYLEGDTKNMSHLLAEYAFENKLPAPVWANYVLDKILTGKNVFTQMAAFAQRSQIPNEIALQAMKEIAYFQSLVKGYEEEVWLSFCGDVLKEQTKNYYHDYLAIAFQGWQEWKDLDILNKLIAFHQEWGFGKLCRYSVIRWQGEFKGIKNPDPIRMDDLIGYKYQKDAIINNTLALLKHNKGNNLLLYGERGTGKSSMVKAVVNEYAALGLCLVDLPRSYMTDIPQIINELKKEPRHYIIFLDDLSFDSVDKEYKELKAILEGGIETLANNVLIYATSNRRHLISESWRDREKWGQEINKNDTLSEKLSLADRFGQTITFPSPEQEEYLQIVLGLAAAAGIKMPEEELRSQALKWAKWQNMPSGRTAKQFVNSIT